MKTGIAFKKPAALKNVRLLRDRILILPDTTAKVSNGGIIIPDTVKDKPAAGLVVITGPGKKEEAMEVKEGDRVRFGSFGGTALDFDGVEYLLMFENEVLAVI